jgi:glutathione peroxidase-family protein
MKYGGSGKLAILAFPSQQFAMEEYGTDREIANFAASQNFPPPPTGNLMMLGSVTGSNAPSIWKYLRDTTGSSDPTWNFASQYLVSKSGVVSVPRNVEAEIAALMAE